MSTTAALLYVAAVGGIVGLAVAGRWRNRRRTMDPAMLDHLHTRFERIEAKLDRNHHLLERIMSALTDLQAAIAAEDSEIAQVIVFIQGVPALVAAAIAAAEAGDAAAVSALQTDVQNQTNALAAALQAATGGATGTPT